MRAAAVVVPEELFTVLGKLNSDGTAVVVEGKKDRAALEAAGIDCGRIFVLSKKPLFAVAEAVAHDYKAAAILTDLDAEGKKLYGKLNALLQQLGVKVDNNIRNFLFKSTKLRQVEGLSTLLKQPSSNALRG